MGFYTKWSQHCSWNRLLNLGRPTCRSVVTCLQFWYGIQGAYKLAQFTLYQKAHWDTQLSHDIEQSHLWWLFLHPPLCPMLGYCECIVDWFLWVLARGVAFYVPWGLFYCPNQGNVNSRIKCDYNLGINKTFSEGSIKTPELICTWEGNMVKRLTEFCGIVFTQTNRHIALASVSSRFTSGYTSVLIGPQPHHTTISNMIILSIQI